MKPQGPGVTQNVQTIPDEKPQRRDTADTSAQPTYPSQPLEQASKAKHCQPRTSLPCREPPEKKSRSRPPGLRQARCVAELM